MVLSRRYGRTRGACWVGSAHASHDCRRRPRYVRQAKRCWAAQGRSNSTTITTTAPHTHGAYGDGVDGKEVITATGRPCQRGCAQGSGELPAAYSTIKSKILQS